ncbi:MAG: SDR family NAD(P)-dependent oxidoreductase [Chlorobi bacterium]|nr:SDR family NAD(P)-dependent oxidoreductase [Chlorobiota bacterium]
MDNKNSIVLITGASSGIGKALALEFYKNNYTVIAAGRNKSKLERLEAQGIHTKQFDITNYGEMEEAVKSIIEEFGGVDILVNNAGYGLMAPIVDVTLSDFKNQFETNLFAQLELTGNVLPSMKEKRKGTIINIGSISGIVTTPFAGAYCASKAAFHAVSDAMRMELSPFGIDVITIKPGGIVSEFGARAADETLNINLSADYLPIKDDLIMRAKSSQIGAMPADKFARKVVKTVSAGKAPAEMFLGTMSFLLPLLKKTLPIKTLDKILNKRFGIDKLKK